MAIKLFNTIKKRKDFLAVAKLGERSFGRYFLLQTLPNDQLSGIFRVGYIATRRIGNAVKRNKCKRRLRELVRQNQANFVLESDYVLIAKHSLFNADFELLKKDFENVIKTASLQTKTPERVASNWPNKGISNSH